MDRVDFRAENSGRVVMVEVGGLTPTLDATFETADVRARILEATLDTAEVKAALGTTAKETRPLGPTTKGIVLLLTTMLVDRVVFRAENSGKVVMVDVGDPPATFDAIIETAETRAASGADTRETRPPGATTSGSVEVPSVKNVERVVVNDMKAERVVMTGDLTVAEAPPKAPRIGDELDLDEAGEGLTAEFVFDEAGTGTTAALNLDETDGGELVFKVPSFSVVGLAKSKYVAVQTLARPWKSPVEYLQPEVVLAAVRVPTMMSPGSCFIS